MIKVRRIAHATFAGWGPPPTPDYHLNRND